MNFDNYPCMNPSMFQRSYVYSRKNTLVHSLPYNRHYIQNHSHIQFLLHGLQYDRAMV